MGRVRFLLLCGLVLSPIVRADEDESVVAYAVTVKLDRGVTYRGMIPRSPLSEQLFASEEIDLSLLPSGGLTKLEHFNGLNGTISLKNAQIRSIRLDRRVDRDGMNDVRQTELVAREARLKDEIVRLKAVYADREARRLAAEAEQAAAAAPVEAEALPPSEQAWIDRFPPKDGWVPDKKSELYHDTVITNARPLTDDERAWLDHFDEWKTAYDHWLELQPEESAPPSPEDEKAGREASGVAQKPAPAASGTTRPSESETGTGSSTGGAAGGTP